MKLNPDCIREILFAIEETTTMHRAFYLDEDNCIDIFPKYNFDIVFYHIRQCDMYGYLYKASFSISNSCTIIDLTPKAHEFINNIRKDDNWHKTKNIALKVGSFSLDTLSKIATGVISSLIKAQLDIN